MYRPSSAIVLILFFLQGGPGPSLGRFRHCGTGNVLECKIFPHISATDTELFLQDSLICICIAFAVQSY